VDCTGIRLLHKQPFLLDKDEAVMSFSTTVQVTISLEARSFIERLGQSEQLEKMIHRASHSVTGLRSIDVALDEGTEEMPPGVVLWAHRVDIGPGPDPTHRDFIAWMAATFPPDVCQNFTLLSVYHDRGR
jgi:hypothetical protein